MKEKLEELNLVMLNEYISVNKSSNPFTKVLLKLDTANLTQLINQYSIFPKNIISFLINSLYILNFHHWTEVSNELLRNINEELGSIQNENEHEKFIFRPHYVILRETILNSLYIDIKKAKPNTSTQIFLNSIHSILDGNNPAIVGGATFALECSAVPELEIVQSLTDQLYKLNNKTMPNELKEFFNFHIDTIEIGHRDRLIANCIKYIRTNIEMNDFEKGFRQVLSIMDIWWMGLGKEILKN